MTSGDTDPMDRVEELIRELATELGPRLDEQGGFDEDGDVPTTLLPTEWCLVVNWSDLDSGTSFVSQYGPHHQLKSHEIGLLLMALDRARGLS